MRKADDNQGRLMDKHSIEEVLEELFFNRTKETIYGSL